MTIVTVEQGDHSVCFYSEERESGTVQAFTKQ